MLLRHNNLIDYVIFFLLFFPFISTGQGKANSDNFAFHTVGEKETVYSIAKRYNVTPDDIYQYNPKSREVIKQGDVLKIPLPQNNQKGKDKNQKTKPAVLLHKVHRKETLYSIAQKYKCTQAEILKLNPGISGLLRKGTILKVPNPDYQPQSSPGISGQNMDYRIVSGDNYFQLKKRFGVDKEELIQLNPSLKNGFKAGMVIQIPLKNTLSGKEKKAENQPVTNEDSTSNIVSPNKERITFDTIRTYNVAFYLPFCGNLNDSINLSAKTINYLEFFEGAGLAVEKMVSEGLKVKLYVYDTYQNAKVVDQLVKKPEFLSFDLIIGPVFPECQRTITELSAKNRIPMVSPLSSDSRYVSSDPYYFQINPDKKLRMIGTADYIINEFSRQNIILLSRGNNNDSQKILTDKLKDKINNNGFHIYNLWNNEMEGFEKLLNPENENFVVMTEDDEANISVAINRLYIASKTYKITLIAPQEYTRLQSINIEYLHNLKLHYLAPYFIDYSNSHVTAFIEKYRKNFSTEPSQFSFQGYDVTTDFLNDLRLYGKKFVSMSPIPKTNLLQADYDFLKTTNFGGYVNHALFIIEYTDNYEVKPVGKINVSYLNQPSDSPALMKGLQKKIKINLPALND